MRIITGSMDTTVALHWQLLGYSYRSVVALSCIAPTVSYSYFYNPLSDHHLISLVKDV